MTIAITSVGRYELSFYDAVVCATARRAGANTLISENMQDGAIYDGISILNPFMDINAAALSALLAA